MDLLPELLWRAPEHLRHSMPHSGSQPGDVYSFGIVLGEIVTREAPYETELGYLELERRYRLVLVFYPRLGRSLLVASSKSCVLGFSTVINIYLLSTPNSEETIVDM